MRTNPSVPTSIDQAPTEKSLVQLYRELHDLTSSPSGEPHVRVYERIANDEINCVAGMELSHYDGILPVSGDALSIIGPGGYRQYVVRQRMHINAVTRHGWALIVEPINDAFLASLPATWIFEAETFDQAFEESAEDVRKEIAEAERQAEEEHLAAEKAKAVTRKVRLAAEAKRAERRKVKRQTRQRSGEGP